MWPFKRRTSKPFQKTSVDQITISKIGSRMISVPTLNFMGPYSESTNKKYTLGWSGQDYLLAINNTVILAGQLEVISDGAVANNGTFVIADSMHGEQLQSTLYVFDLSGNNLIKKYFSANQVNTSISTDGKYAVYQCANSHTEDGGVLAFFDIKLGKMLWKIKPVSGWADSYSFDLKNKFITLEYRDKGKYLYDFRGNFIDEDKWNNERITFESPFGLLRIAEEKYKAQKGSLSNKEAIQLISILNRVLNELDNDSWRQSKARRLLGEINEELGDLAAAIKNYEIALLLNEKVGVKNRLTCLKKQIS